MDTFNRNLGVMNEFKDKHPDDFKVEVLSDSIKFYLPRVEGYLEVVRVYRLEDNATADIIVEQINGTCYIFDTPNCAVTFKKFMNIYGSNFADQ